METHRPSECKWCGAGDARLRLNGWKVFRCGANYDVDVDEWTHGDTCADTLRDRIQRALAKIKSSKRWSVEKIAKTPIEYYVDPDGWIAQASDMDDVARILEGDADEQ